MVDSVIREAKEYAERGWKVFPLHTMRDSSCSCGNPKCTSAAKHPRIKEWQKHCSNDSEQIEYWWQKWPDANVGLATGSASGFFVLDIDPRHGGKESLQKLVKKNGGLPKTLGSHTGGGGFHLFFNEPKVKLGNRANVLPGIDVRGDGGYIVAPPSFHKSGMQYSWIKEFKGNPINDAPFWMLNLFLKGYSANEKINGSGSVAEGGRNSFLASEAGKLRNLGLDQYELEKRLSEINQTRCNPPLEQEEIRQICKNMMRYVPKKIVSTMCEDSNWPKQPGTLDFSAIKAPTLPEDMLPEIFKPWIMDIADRMQVTPEFVMAPALVSLAAAVGRKLGIRPKQKDDWLVVPNVWGAIVARPGYFKSPTIAEAMKPLDKLTESAHVENEHNQHQANASKMIAEMQLESLKDRIRKAIKECDHEKVEELRHEAVNLDAESEESASKNKRYKTNDTTTEKLARLLNENPNGMLLLRDELDGWLQMFNKAGREGDRPFYLEAWSGKSSYTVDRVGSGTLHVPALCLSVFGGIQPGKLQSYVEKTLKGGSEDDGLLQRFQVLVYPEFTKSWVDVDREPDALAFERVTNLFEIIAAAKNSEGKDIPFVRFSDSAQEAFVSWRAGLEEKIRSNDASSAAFESHLSKYRKLMPALSLLFWIIEDANNIHGAGKVSFDATTMAVKWCEFLEKHALKVYRIGRSSEMHATKQMADCINSGQITHKATVRSIYRRHWRGLNTPHLVDQALETLEDRNWLRVVHSRVQGGSSKRVMLHPRLQQIAGGLK